MNVTLNVREGTRGEDEGDGDGKNFFLKVEGTHASYKPPPIISRERMEPCDPAGSSEARGT